MSVIALRLVATGNPVAMRFSSKKAAANYGNNWYFPASVEDLAKQTALAPTGAMVAVYNSLSPTKITKFENRDVAAARLWKLITDNVKETDTMPTTDKMAAAMKDANKKTTEAAAAKKAAVKGPKTDRKGRSSKLSGQRITAVKKDGKYANTRRPNSIGYRSYDLLVDAGDKGMLTEDYVKQGGRLVDLKWDIDHGNAKVAPAA